MSVVSQLFNGEIFYDPETDEVENMEYIFLLCDELYNDNGVHYPYRFFNRQCKGLIKEPFDKDKFLTKYVIVPTLQGFGIDLEKFWWVLLFIYDWTEQTFTNCLDIKSHSYGMLLRDLLDKLGDNWSDVTINIRKGKKNLTVNPSIKRVMLNAVQSELEQLKKRGNDNLVAYRLNDFTQSYTTLSYKIYFATGKLRQLFELLERYKKLIKPKRSKNSIVSYNKMLLFSRIMCLYRYGDKEHYLDSDEALKAVMKDYKGRVPSTISSVYD